MKKAAANPTTKSPSGSSHFTLRSLAIDFIDTAWRIAVPVLIFSGVGIFLDIKLSSAPWFTLLGMIVGFAFAIVLLKEQLRSAMQKDKEA